MIAITASCHAPYTFSLHSLNLEIGSIVLECKAPLNNFVNFVSSIKWASSINLVLSLEIEIVLK